MNYTVGQVVIGNISTNLTTNTNNLRYICELDGMTMMNQLEKMPKVAFWFLISAVLILLIYMFIPKLKQYIVGDQLIYPIFMILLVSAYLYSTVTFNITKENYQHIIKPILNIMCALMVIYIIYKERVKIKEVLKRLKREI